MSTPQLALHYARALYEVASATGQLETATRDVQTVAELLNTVPGLRDYCVAHLSDPGTDQVLVESAFVPSVSATTGRMLRLVAAHNRLGLLGLLAPAWQRLLDQQTEVLAVVVEAANPPEAPLLLALQEKLRARTGRHVRLRVTQNPDLRGGFLLEWNNRHLDASLAGRLAQLRAHLTGPHFAAPHHE